MCSPRLCRRHCQPSRRAAAGCPLQDGCQHLLRFILRTAWQKALWRQYCVADTVIADKKPVVQKVKNPDFEKEKKPEVILRRRLVCRRQGREDCKTSGLRGSYVMWNHWMSRHMLRTSMRRGRIPLPTRSLPLPLCHQQGQGEMGSQCLLIPWTMSSRRRYWFGALHRMKLKVGTQTGSVNFWR